MNHKNIRYYRLGRQALLAGLKLLKIQPGETVLMPAFICRDLLAPLHDVGALPAFYNLDRKLQPVELPEAKNVRAVLAVNYFGFPQELAPFRTYCLRHQSVLIEDNAHGFLSRDATGALLGERGDLGIFSFRKTLLLPDGGALLVNKPEFQAYLEPQLPCSSKLLPLNYWGRYTFTKFQRQTGLNLISLAQDLIRHIRRFRTGQGLPLSDPASEFIMPADPAPHCRSLSMLLELNAATEVTRRRNLYKKVHRLLINEDIEPIFDDLPEGVVPYGYPFYADHQSLKEVMKLSHGLGLDCSCWPDLPAAVEPSAPAHYRSVWLINFL